MYIPRVPRAFFLGVALAPACFSTAWADAVVHVHKGASWKFFAGTSEASSPDPAAWRTAGFSDAGWPALTAPIGYGDPEIATDLAARSPPMQGNYSSIFLRKTFSIADAAQVLQLLLNADYDDGFIAWINGVEVLRANLNGAPGDAVAATGLAAGSHESGEYEIFDLPVPQAYLTGGVNVLAVQVFNVTLANTDLRIDLELVEPFGPDSTPPAVVSLVPPAGATVRTLTGVEVTFSEEVTGVTAGDLLVNGAAAASVSGSGPGPYLFAFPAPPAGGVQVKWASGHGIADLSAHAFAGGEWSYTVDPLATVAEVILSEFLASNSGPLLDEDQEPSDWIEIQNAGGAPVNLEGWSLSDDPQDPGRWTFPAVSLPAGSFLLVFASGKDRKPTAGSLHTNFKLAAGGEYLGLFTPDFPRRAASEFAPRYPEQRTGISYGVREGGERSWFDPPTPGAANGAGAGYLGFVTDPVFSVPHGYYSDPLSLEIASRAPGATIYYTLDGSEPDPASATLYGGPIPVAGSAGRAVVTVRAAAFRDGYLPSRVVTSSYLFPEFVLLQPPNPAGFPATWGSTQPADYRVDPRVIDAPGNQELALRALESIPTLSIVTPVGNLFDRSRGIYANPAVEGLAWERPVSAELIYPNGMPGADGRRGFQVDCGLRVQGGSSTSGWKSIKVSLRLLFRGDYGLKKLDFPLFSDSAVDRFDSLVLDAHLNLTFTHPDHNQRVRSQYARDVFVSDLQNAMGSLAPHSFFSHLYLDGLYWGVYEIHERPDADFAAEHLGGEKEEYDVLRHNSATIVDGTLAAYQTMFTRARQLLTVDANYRALQEYLDIPDLCDYLIVNFFAGNDDWAHQNWYAGRRRAPGAGFRYFSWDAEHVLKDVNINQTGLNNQGGPTELFTRLRSNPEFRLLFADHVHRHFSRDGTLWVDPSQTAWDPAHPERNRPAALYMRRIAEIDAAMVLESARWGDARRPELPYTRENEWLTELNWLLTNYFPRRSGMVLTQFRAVGLYPNVAPPLFSLPAGKVAPGTQIELSLPAPGTGTMLFTTDGSDPRTYGTGAVSPSATAYAGPLTLTDRTHLKARTLNGAVWSALNEAVYTVLRPRDALRITEIMYHAPAGPEGDFLEIQNTSPSTTVDLTGLRISEGVTYQPPAGRTLGPGEFLLLVQDPATFATLYPGLTPDGAYQGSLSNGGERVALVDELGQTVASVDYDEEGLWPRGPDGLGFSLVLESPSGNPDDPASWRASAHRGGSPGAADPPAPPGSVLVSEVLARSRPPLEDAIEIFNPSSRAIDVSGWYLSDSHADEASLKKFRIPGGTVLGPGEFRVFYEVDFNHPLSPTAFALDSSGDDVFLAAADAAGELTGHVTGYEFKAAELGVSLGLVVTSQGLDFAPLAERTFGADSPASVEDFRRGAGALNAGARSGEAVINEIHYNPPDGIEFLEIRNLLGSDLPLFDAALARGWRLNGVRDVARNDDFEFAPGTVVPAGGYLVLSPIEPESFRTLRGLPASAVVVGPYGGGLENEGELLELLKPLAGDAGVAYAVVDRVRFRDRAPWPSDPDGLGPSLERTQAAEYGSEPLNWAASLADGGTPAAPNSTLGGVNQRPVPLFTASPAAGDPLSLVLDAGASRDTDGNIVEWEWDFGDGLRGTGKVVNHRFPATGIYTVKLTVTDDGGARSGTSRSVEAGDPSEGGRQLPGDGNQDGALNISDPVILLLYLFGDAGQPLPCDGATIHDGGNRALLDVNADREVDVSDAVHLLAYLFLAGAPPAAGEACLPIAGCPEACPR